MKIRWRIREMILVTIIVALAVPYFINWLPDELDPLTSFSISEKELESWLQEVDSTARIDGFEHPGEVMNKIFQSDSQYTVQMQHSTHQQLMDQIYMKVGDKISKGKWNRSRSYGTGDYCVSSFQFSNG